MRCVRFGIRFVVGKRYEILCSDAQKRSIRYRSIHNRRVSNLKNIDKKKLYGCYTPIPYNVRSVGYRYGTSYKKVFGAKFVRFDKLLF